MELRKNAKKGFSLMELVVVLAITAVLVLIALPVGINLINEGKRIKNDNMARSLYLAAQNALTEMKTRGELGSLAQFAETGGDVVIVGGYLSHPSDTAGKLDTNLVPVPQDTENAPYLYYLSLSSAPGAPDDPMLIELLYPYIIDKTVLEQAITIELNANTGVVKSAFYSEVFPSFKYDDSADPNNAARFRVSTYQMGFYGVDTTGSPQTPVMPLKVQLLDEQMSAAGGIPNALYAVAWVPDTDTEYTLEATDKGEATVVDAATQKDVALTLRTQGPGAVSQGSLAAALTVPYADLAPAEHSGGLTTTPGQRLHTVYMDPGVADPFNTGIAVYKKITWVIDYVDPGTADMPSLVNSIGNKYAAIGPLDMKVRVREASNTANTAISLSRHSYYSSALQDGTYLLTTVRHFTNVRYTGLGQQTSPAKYRQVKDLDLAFVRNFAPLNWLPVNNGTAFDTGNAFGGAYTAADIGGKSYRISNLTMTNRTVATDDYGLFGALQNGSVQAVYLEKLQLASYVSNNVGAFAGRMAGLSDLSQCSAYANIRVDSVGAPGGDINIGGLVGNVAGGSVRLSYNGGYYNASGKTPDTDEETLNFGYVKLGGDTRFTGRTRIGGLAGIVGAGASVSNSYNNARVNVDSVTYTDVAGTPTAYLSLFPVFTPLQHSNYERVSLGGVVAENNGSVTRTYATNFVAIYSGTTDISKSAAIIAVNNGTESGNLAIRNNLSSSVGSSATHFVTKDQLAATATLGSAWLGGRGYTLQLLPKANSWDPELYPYPTLRSNLHVTPWEDIWGIEEVELAWATADNSLVDELGAHYKGVRVETRENFYLYNTTKMTLTLVWDSTRFDLDDSRIPALNKTITTSGSTKTLVAEITNGAMYDLRFYSVPNGTAPTTNITVICEVPGGASGMADYQMTFEG